MKIAFFYAIFFFLMCNISFAAEEKTLILHFNGKIVEHRKKIFEWADNDTNILNLYPGSVIKKEMCSNINLYFVELDAKSDSQGIIYLIESNHNIEVLEYLYTVDDVLSEFLLYDVDRDSNDEIITLWETDDSFNVRIDKIKISDKKVDVNNIYISNVFGNPNEFKHNKKLCVNQNLLYILYYFNFYKNGIAKIGVIDSNPDDKTGELYFKPIGIISATEWGKICER